MRVKFKPYASSIAGIALSSLFIFALLGGGLLDQIRFKIEHEPFFAYQISAISGVVALIFLGLFFSRLKNARVIENTPTSKIRSAHQGYVELIGKGMSPADNEPILSRLTKTPCLWYRYSVEKYVRRGNSSKWVTVDQGESSDVFVISDGTGECFVDPAGAEVTPAKDAVTWGGLTPMPTSNGELSNRMALRILSGIMGAAGQYRYREERIEPGSDVIVIGEFKTVSGGEGKVNSATNYIRKPSNGGSFLISDLSHDDFVGRLKRFNLLLAAAFCFFAAATVWAIVTKFYL